LFPLGEDVRRPRNILLPLRLFSLAPFALAGVLLFLQVQQFNQKLQVYPPGLEVASVPVGGLDRAAARERLLEAYSTPVELIYDNQIVHLDPQEAGFVLHVDEMLDAVDQQIASRDYWQAFWDDLMGAYPEVEDIPLSSSYSEGRARLFLLEEVAPRYDKPPSAPRPYPGMLVFLPGETGTILDLEPALPPIARALTSLTERQVELPLATTPPSDPVWSDLDIFLRQTIELSGFSGTLGMYVNNLQTGEDIHLLYHQNSFVSTEPDAAFSASSTIKIPIMVSVFRRIGEDPNPEIVRRLERMIGYSDNLATDWLVQQVMDRNYGPIEVTDDIAAIGMKNTFWAGYFTPGAPLLRRYDTPSNLRADLNITRDPYNQTTSSEMGVLLADIYQCAEYSGGSLLAIFPGEITQTECRQMIDYLIMDRIPLLIQYGVPDGILVAHKHGWITSFRTGMIQDISDAGIVFTPGGDYVLSIYLYHPVQLLFDPNNKFIADLSRVVYNYFNPPYP
jgi:beta-lactamase class A